MICMIEASGGKLVTPREVLLEAIISEIIEGIQSNRIVGGCLVKPLLKVKCNQCGKYYEYNTVSDIPYKNVKCSCKKRWIIKYKR